jgi:hypothetical protein
MKLSVSLSEDDLMFLDEYAAETGIRTRSGVIQVAISELRRQTMIDQYAQAWEEWVGSDDAVAWESTTADGIDGAA